MLQAMDMGECAVVVGGQNISGSVTGNICVTVPKILKPVISGGACAEVKIEGKTTVKKLLPKPKNGSSKPKPKQYRYY